MEPRTNAVTFKGNPLTLLGPQLHVGDKAPDFSCVNGSLEIVRLSDTPAKARLFSVVPSLDTPVCSIQTRQFDKSVSTLKDQVAVYTVSLDLPFAQKRFCETEGISTGVTLSDVHDQSFGKNYGVLIEGLPIPLLARAVFVLDRNGQIVYVEYVAEVTNQPNYEAALDALHAAV